VRNRRTRGSRNLRIPRVRVQLRRLAHIVLSNILLNPLDLVHHRSRPISNLNMDNNGPRSLHTHSSNNSYHTSNKDIKRISLYMELSHHNSKEDMSVYKIHT
jgi:hypothetical protein